MVQALHGSEMKFSAQYNFRLMAPKARLKVVLAPYGTKETALKAVQVYIKEPR